MACSGVTESAGSLSLLILWHSAPMSISPSFLSFSPFLLLHESVTDYFPDIAEGSSTLGREARALLASISGALGPATPPSELSQHPGHFCNGLNIFRGGPSMRRRGGARSGKRNISTNSSFPSTLHALSLLISLLRYPLVFFPLLLLLSPRFVCLVNPFFFFSHCPPPSVVFSFLFLFNLFPFSPSLLPPSINPFPSNHPSSLFSFPSSPLSPLIPSLFFLIPLSSLYSFLSLSSLIPFSIFLSILSPSLYSFPSPLSPLSILSPFPSSFSLLSPISPSSHILSIHPSLPSSLPLFSSLPPCAAVWRTLPMLCSLKTYGLLDLLKLPPESAFDFQCKGLAGLGSLWPTLDLSLNGPHGHRLLPHTNYNTHTSADKSIAAGAENHAAASDFQL
ncbi:hypothetical protein C7M84_018650 [Penaeus vannamei]|uniref:Uncharacterized protein n=1 Tax=Penaeus vannamei TaxID=6689 RepID=A0A3R7PWV8_PENVA|nr:hypothetical protein C7M84_018650 [Penaeus vannamei]